MISFETSRFGRLEVGKDKIIDFPSGLIGFPETKRFILMDYKDTSLKWLQAVDDPDIAFIVTPPFELFPDFAIKVENVTKKTLGIENEDDMVILAILRVEADNVTANLQGPLVINSMNKNGMQIVIDDARFTCKTPLHCPPSETAK